MIECKQGNINFNRMVQGIKKSFKNDKLDYSIEYIDKETQVLSRFIERGSSVSINDKMLGGDFS